MPPAARMTIGAPQRGQKSSSAVGDGRSSSAFCWHVAHNVAWGSASSRSRGIGLPHDSQTGASPQSTSVSSQDPAINPTRSQAGHTNRGAIASSSSVSSASLGLAFRRSMPCARRRSSIPRRSSTSDHVQCPQSSCRCRSSDGTTWPQCSCLESPVRCGWLQPGETIKVAESFSLSAREASRSAAKFSERKLHGSRIAAVIV